MPVPVIAGLSRIAGAYEGVIVDLWGTLHDGLAPYPGAVEALERLLSAGARVAVLSNAPRRAGSVAQAMHGIGFPADAGYHVFTSGEEAWRAVAERPDDWYRGFGRRCYHMGSARDRGMLDNPGLEPVAEIGAADFVLCTGLARPEETVDDYQAALTAAAGRGLPMVCANPDYVVMRGGTRELCAGALARHYEGALGGRVRWHGKPHASVYESCMALIGVADPARVIMIGDSLRTDVAGAAALGMATAFIPGGIHGDELGVAWGEVPPVARLQAAFEADGVRPTTILPAFAW